MRRILLLVTVASMLAAAMALSGVAQAKSPIVTKADAKCEKLAIKTLGPSFNPSNYTFIGGTEGADDFTAQSDAAIGLAEVYCGFGGIDQMNPVYAGDIFLGGADNDFVPTNHGTFYGQEGDDFVSTNKGTFFGGDGNDSVRSDNFATFNGGDGNDSVPFNSATFNGDDGNDSVGSNAGTFNGDDGDDSVVLNDSNGTFNGGDGDDSIITNFGTTDSVENGV